MSARARSSERVYHPALAPIEHVDRDNHVALAGQVGRDAAAGVVALPEFGEDGMLALLSQDLFLAPQIEAAMIV